MGARPASPLPASVGSERTCWNPRCLLSELDLAVEGHGKSAEGSEVGGELSGAGGEPKSPSAREAPAR